MTDVWLFGTFHCTNYLESDNTRNYKEAKWRSQIKVPQGSRVTDVYVAAHPYNWVQVRLNGVFQTHAVYISDLQYQLRWTGAQSNVHWLKFTNSSKRRGDADDFLWFRAGTVTEYQEPLFNPNPNPSSPNPFVKPTPTPKPLIDLGYLNFAEERLELGFDYGAVGGMAFQTEIVEVASDREQRNALRYLPLGRWQLGERTLLESEIEKIQEVGYLKSFHAARRGSFQGFRFKDWSDYQVLNQLIGIGDGVTDTFQLSKSYSVGSASFERPIVKPIVSTFVYYFEFLPSGYQTTVTLDETTGLVTLDPALPFGAMMLASFEFDIPVWFESDQIGFKLAGYDEKTGEAIYLLESVFVEEGRIPYDNWVAQPNHQIERVLDLGIVYETIEQYQFYTVKQELRSGYIKRDSKRPNSQKFINLGSRIYNKLEIEQILSYFWLAKGKLTPFPFRNLDLVHTVRFEQDELNLKFEGASRDEGGNIEETLFSLPGLKLQVIPTVGLLRHIINKATTVYFCIDSSASLSVSVPAINDAIALWQNFLADNNYDLTIVELTYSHERWLKVVNDNFATNALYLIWSNEAAPSYHSTLTFTPAAANFISDRSDYLAQYPQRNSCKIIVFSISNAGAAFDIFNGQLFAAKEGLLGYSPPLEDYGMEAIVNLDPATTATEWFDYFQNEAIATDFVPTNTPQGLLKYISAETTVYCCVDTSASLASSLPAIQSAIADWQAFLSGNSYQVTFIQLNYSHERWLKVVNDNFAPDALYLIWTDEAAPSYHSNSSFSPAANFVSDRSNYLTQYPTRDFCKVIVHSISSLGSATGMFNSHLAAAKSGSSGYSPALADYGLDTVVNIDPATTGATWLNYLKTEAIANTFVGTTIQGLMKYVSRETKIYFCLDTSGSIDYCLAALNSAINSWKSVIANNFYGAAWVASNTEVVNYTHERWLKIPTDKFNKDALYLIWSSEAEPFYHSSSGFSPAGADFVTDRTNFLANFATRDFCKILVHSFSIYGSDFTVFNNQLAAAKNGASGYSPALGDYGLDIVTLLNPDLTSADWLTYFQNEAIANNFTGIGGIPPISFPSSGLVRYYRLESLSPITDSVGSGGTLIFKNGQSGTLATGKNGQGFFFDSGSKGFGGIPLRTAETSVSVSLWYKTANAANGKTIFGDFTTDTNNGGSLRANIYANSVELWCSHKWGQSSYTQGTKLINDNQFHHIVFTYNATDKKTKLYLDNVFQATPSYNQSSELLNFPVVLTDNPLFFNVKSNTGNGADNSTFDEIGIWNITLTAAQIADLYNNGAGTFF